MITVKAGFKIEWSHNRQDWFPCHPMGPYFTAKRDAVAHMSQMPFVKGLTYRIVPVNSKAKAQTWTKKRIRT